MQKLDHAHSDELKAINYNNLLLLKVRTNLLIIYFQHF